MIQRQYRSITRRAYYRLARADRDTVGRPSCRTDAGRVVYGGGGIYPDVAHTADDPAPLWLSRLRENDVVLQWAGAYFSASGSALPTIDALAANPTLVAALLDPRVTMAAQQFERADGILAKGP